MNLCRNQQELNFELLPVVQREENLSNIHLSPEHKLCLGNNYAFPEDQFSKYLENRADPSQPVILIDSWAHHATSKAIRLLPSGSRILLAGNLSEKT
jgi:hypothetical protein